MPHRTARRLHRFTMAAAVVTAAVALIAAPAAAEAPSAGPLPPGDLLLISTTTEGVKFPGDSADFSLSGDGGRVVFVTRRQPFGGPFAGDVYLREVATGEVRLVSTTSDDVPADGVSSSTDISQDGRTVAFSSTATNLVPEETNNTYQVYVKNLGTGAAELASTTNGGLPGDRSEDPELSADGRIVAFTAGKLERQGSFVLSYSVQVKNLDTGELIAAGTTDTGVEADSHTYVESISADGRLVLFSTYAGNLDPADTDSLSDFYLKDLTTGDVRLVSGSAPNSVLTGRLSADGSTVAYESTTDGVVQAVVVDLATEAITVASTSVSGALGNQNSYPGALSADGTKVLLTSSSGNFDPRLRRGARGLYVKDVVTGALELVSTSDAGVPASASPFGTRFDADDMSADGSSVVFATNALSLDPADQDINLDGYLKSVGGVSARSPRVAEGDTGAGVVPFTITLSRPVTTRVSVAYATTDGTAVSGVDYVARTGRVSIPAGLRRTVVFVPLLPDSTAEPDETFTLTLSAPSGAGIQNPTATATIANDD